MSKILEGKLSNQFPKSLSITKGIVKCECCVTTFEHPEINIYRTEKAQYNLYSYLGSDRFIYESNSGRAVVYCSDYCRKKHNHRFQK